jgi:hypothetical protein
MAKSKYSLILRTCHVDFTSYGGFKWPKKGPVSCPDWDSKPVCGHGLHGLLWGEGNGELLNWNSGAVWQVVRVLTAEIVEIDKAKVKFPGGTVLYSGTREKATSYIYKHGGEGKRIAGLMVTGGDCSTLTGGYYSTLTGGDYSTLTGGDYSTLTGGYCSTLTGGDRSTLTGGYHSTLTGGDYSTLTGGDYSTLTGGDRSTLTGGDRSTLTGGDYSTLIISRWENDRRKIYTACVGEDGILPDVPYKLDDNGRFVRADGKEEG